jgi:uncharacterized integral membrane protein
MKKATLIIWVIIFGFIALVIFQNQSFFLAKQTLRLNLGVLEEYQSPAMPNAIIALIFFFAGLLIAFLFSISARFKANRTIRKLNAAIAAHNGELAGLKSEIDKLKGIDTTPQNQSDTIKIGMDATQKISDEIPGDKAAESPGDKTEESPGDKTEEYEMSPQETNPNQNTEEKPEEKSQ